MKRKRFRKTGEYPKRISFSSKELCRPAKPVYAIFAPKIETQLGAKVLWDSSAGKNYLWVTGEVYNRGFGMAFNTVLEIKIFIANSTVPLKL